MQQRMLKTAIGLIALLAVSAMSAASTTGVENNASLDTRATALWSTVFYAMTISHAWGHHRQGVYITASGDVFAFAYEPTERDWNPAPNAAGRISLVDLQARFNHHPRWLRKLDTQDMQTCQSVFASLRDVVHPINTGGVRYDAPTELRGEYRLDPESGRYIEVPCALENK